MNGRDQTPGAEKIADRYVRGAPLGLGGMGELWEGTDTRLNRAVAIKLIRPARHIDEDTARRRFYREARILGRLRHPGIPVLYDFGPHGDDLFIVMELVEGAMTLRDLVAERGPELLPIGWAGAIGAQLCAALAAAHRAGLIHRDLTPSNVVLTRSGTLKILDFGVAMAVDTAEFSEITHPGEVPGSLFYTAPEIDGHTKADARSDLYSLGCLLYELLAGRRAFQAASAIEELRRHHTEEPTALSDIRDNVPEDLEQVVSALLAKEPENRPADAAQVFDALISHANGLTPLPTLPLKPGDPDRMYALAVASLPNYPAKP
ncbi:serine/threonine-protein kinase [Actinomadura physcomitrii]|uniref:serine/threonine-protein kinase n=1 Tax=Actinomadura physcomitrii TaxID=2650748 RepID=UPI001369156F|nr:serine/threonine-protein kinase [Actinomadura physcomitrii]